MCRYFVTMCAHCFKMRSNFVTKCACCYITRSCYKMRLNRVQQRLWHIGLTLGFNAIIHQYTCPFWVQLAVGVEITPYLIRKRQVIGALKLDLSDPIQLSAKVSRLSAHSIFKVPFFSVNAKFLLPHQSHGYQKAYSLKQNWNYWVAWLLSIR